MTLYTQVSSNRTKTWFFLFLYGLIILALGWLVSWYFEYPGIVTVAAIVVIIQGFTSYFYSDKIALLVSRAVPLEPNQYPEVHKLVENLSITAGLPMPRLYLIDDTAMNAFATGRDPQHAAVAVTQGLLDRLDTNELQGVLAHELAHIGNEDIRLMSMVMIMAGLITLISDFFLRSMFWGGRDREDRGGNSNGILMLVALVFIILAPLAATLIQLAISRKREFMADATGVLLTRYPEGLISALRKISQDAEPLEVANKATAHMYFSNPLHGGFLANMFATHPPVEHRIAALAQGGGLHVQE